MRRASCATGSAGRCLRVAPVLESLSKGVAPGPLDCLSVRACADRVGKGRRAAAQTSPWRPGHGGNTEGPEAGGISQPPNVGLWKTSLGGRGFPKQGGHADWGEAEVANCPLAGHTGPQVSAGPVMLVHTGFSKTVPLAAVY